jgi:hypothetical protein
MSEVVDEVLAANQVYVRSFGAKRELALSEVEAATEAGRLQSA